MQTIARDDLKQWMDKNNDFMLVEALSEEDFNEAHLPGAVNIPLEDRDFEAKVNLLLPDKNKPVVVYCANLKCPASTNEAQKLESMGYNRVYDYEAGKEDWRKAGYNMAQ